ncbi:hypothetical protein E1A91_D06G042600v1 [Gossypium mustelinum]|uniref:Uncharacterized protein n=1 Tax=Gossypium mustelinum TaxID=34275 RepID=A0A5D2UE76_GOSMU|nr:hypothetical protein E1A91_D06G042600v1 [Gossypium mustelinum]
MKSLTLLAPLLLCVTLPCSSLNVASDSAAAALAILKWKASLQSQSQNHSVLLYFVYLLFKLIIVLNQYWHFYVWYPSPTKGHHFTKSSLAYR